MKTLFLIRGLPGSGKSTFATHLVPDFLICEADKFFVVDGEYVFDREKLGEAHSWCQKTVEAYMQNSEMFPKIAVANTFTRDWELNPYFDLADKYDYTVFSVIVENHHGNDSVHNVSNETVNKMRNRFEINL